MIARLARSKWRYGALRVVIVLFALGSVAGQASAGFALHLDGCFGHSHSITAQPGARMSDPHAGPHAHLPSGDDEHGLGGQSISTVMDHDGQTGGETHHGSDHIHGLGCCGAAGVIPDQVLVQFPASRKAVNCCSPAALLPHAPDLLKRPPRISA